MATPAPAKRPREGGAAAPPPKKARKGNKEKVTAPPSPPVLSNTKTRTQDSEHVPLSALVGPNARYAHGFLQLPPSEEALVAAQPPPTTYVFPQRHEQTLATLVPAGVKPLAHLLLDRPFWSENSPHDILRNLYTPLMVARVAKLRTDPGASAEKARAARIVEATTAGELDVALRAESRVPSANVPQLLTAPSVKQQRSIRLVDPVTGPVPQKPAFVPQPVNSLDAETAQRVRALATQLAGEKDGKPKPVTNKHTTRAQFIISRERAHAVYYAHDPVPDPDLSYGLRPSAYPSFNALLGDARQTWEQRYAFLRDAGTQMPRVSVEVTTRAYRHTYRMPVSTFKEQEQRRPCCKGLECRVYVFARSRGKPNLGYNPPEFLTPLEERGWLQRRASGVPLSEEKPAGPCGECTDYLVTMRTTVYERSLKPPPQPINRTRVLVGEGEYARDVMLPVEVYGVRTGIEGHVPVYDVTYREFGQVPLGPGGQTITVLCEVNVDFRMSLDQMNACLGVRKARPLAGVTGERWVSMPDPVLALRDPTVWVPAATISSDEDAVAYVWHFYARTLPLPMLADRALVLPHVDATLEAKVVASRGRATEPRFASPIPAVWLRRAVLTAPFSPHVTLLLMRQLTPAVATSLARAFETATATELRAVLGQLAVHAYTTFERSVSFVMRESNSVYVRVPLQFFFESARYGTWARAAFEDASTLLRPSGWSADDARSWRGRWVLWTTCVWRIAVALLFERVLKANWWDAQQERDVFVYKTHQFVCTHVDFLTVFEAHRTRGQEADAGNDMWWLRLRSSDHEEARLTRVYPQCTRAPCAEELPDGTPLRRVTNPWYDMANKKTHNTKNSALAHVEIKTAQHNCMTRGFDNVLYKAMAHYPAIADLYAQIVRCVLMGSYPRAVARPELPALLRINAAFAPRTALMDGVTPELEDAHRVRVRQWLMRRPLITRNLMREHYVTTLERSTIYDDMFHQTRHWAMLKAVMRQCNIQLRRAVSALLVHEARYGRTPQTRAVFVDLPANVTQQQDGDSAEFDASEALASASTRKAPQPPVTWDMLEYRPGKTSYGEIQRWHDRQKDHNTKLFKAPELVLLARKMKPVESELASYGYTHEKGRAYLSEEQRDTALHVLAYITVHQLQLPLADGSVRPALPTGLLKVIGMSEKSHAELRQWMHASVEYHAADDSLTKLVWQMAQRDWRDFVLLRVYVSLIEFYSDFVLSFASVEHTRAQWLALRASLGLSASTVAPPGLGQAHYCESCLKWGHVISRPSREYLGFVLPPIREDTAEEEEEQNQEPVATAPLSAMPPFAHLSRADALANVQNTLIATKAQILQEYKKRRRVRPFPARPIHIANGTGASFTRVQYNPLDTKLYCTGGKKLQGFSGGVLEEEEASAVSDDDDEEDEDDDDDEGERREATPAATPTTTTAAKKPTKPKQPELAVLLGMFPKCESQPMIALDLVGVYKRHHKHLYTLCVYCGCKCEAIACNMTNLGMSCGEHALTREYPRWHRIWRHIQRPPDAPTTLSFATAQEMLRQAGNNTNGDQGTTALDASFFFQNSALRWRRFLTHACACCGHHDLLAVPFWLYDKAFRLYEIHLCRYDVSRVRPVLPRATMGEQLVPLPVALFRSQLGQLTPPKSVY